MDSEKSMSLSETNKDRLPYNLLDIHFSNIV